MILVFDFMSVIHSICLKPKQCKTKQKILASPLNHLPFCLNVCSAFLIFFCNSFLFSKNICEDSLEQTRFSFSNRFSFAGNQNHSNDEEHINDQQANQDQRGTDHDSLRFRAESGTESVEVCQRWIQRKWLWERLWIQDSLNVASKQRAIGQNVQASDTKLTANAAKLLQSVQNSTTSVVFRNVSAIFRPAIAPQVWADWKGASPSNESVQAHSSHTREKLGQQLFGKL